MRYKINFTRDGLFCMEAEATAVMTFENQRMWAFSNYITQVVKNEVGNSLTLHQIMEMPVGSSHMWSFTCLAEFTMTIERIA